MFPSTPASKCGAPPAHQRAAQSAMARLSDAKAWPRLHALAATRQVCRGEPRRKRGVHKQPREEHALPDLERHLCSRCVLALCPPALAHTGLRARAQLSHGDAGRKAVWPRGSRHRIAGSVRRRVVSQQTRAVPQQLWWCSTDAADGDAPGARDDERQADWPAQVRNAVGPHESAAAQRMRCGATLSRAARVRIHVCATSQHFPLLAGEACSYCASTAQVRAGGARRCMGAVEIVIWDLKDDKGAVRHGWVDLQPPKARRACAFKL